MFSISFVTTRASPSGLPGPARGKSFYLLGKAFPIPRGNSMSRRQLREPAAGLSRGGVDRQRRLERPARLVAAPLSGQSAAQQGQDVGPTGLGSQGDAGRALGVEVVAGRDRCSSAHGRNLGTGVAHSINQLVDVVLAAKGHSRESYPVHHESVRPGDQVHMAADVSLIKEVLGWSPKVSFQDGMAETVRYFSDEAGG